MSRGDEFAPGKPHSLTQQQINELVYQNSEMQAAWAKDPHVIRSRQLYADNAGELLADLGKAGFSVESVGQMCREHPDYKAAVPILIKWLPAARYLPLAEDIVRALSVAFARPEAVPIFIKLFGDPPDVDDPMRPANAPKSAKEHLRWVIGNGLGLHASPAIAEELIEFAQERSYGAG